MATVTLPVKDVPVEEYDVLVAGGGPAGCTAAIAAARDGARTLLVEQFNCLGGMGTAGLVPAWCPFSDEERVIYRGLAVEIFEELKRRMPTVPKEKVDWVAIEPELLKLIYDRRVTEAGVEVRFQTQVVDVLTEADVRISSPSPSQGEDGGEGGGRAGQRETAPHPHPLPGGERGSAGRLLRLTHAVIANKVGLTAVRAKVFVDATGDGDLAAWAGAEFEKGDADTGAQQPTTLCFVLAGIDTERFQAWREEPGANRHNLRSVIAKAKADGNLDIPDHSANIAHQTHCTLGFNFSHIFDVDGTDPRQLSKAMIDGRKLAHHLADFMRDYCEGCEHAVMAQTAIALGVRETRRIIGDYVLTADDYHARRSFPDEIARNCYYIDVHATQEELARADPMGRGWKERGQPYDPGESHGIPYRCLTPRGLTNVLVAGRSISCDRAVQGSVRVMPVCLVMGEAAGCAAALALPHDGDVRAIDVQDLRRRLQDHGAWLPDMAD